MKIPAKMAHHISGRHVGFRWNEKILVFKSFAVDSVSPCSQPDRYHLPSSGESMSDISATTDNS